MLIISHLWNRNKGNDRSESIRICLYYIRKKGARRLIGDAGIRVPRSDLSLLYKKERGLLTLIFYFDRMHKNKEKK